MFDVDSLSIRFFYVKNADRPTAQENMMEVHYN